MSDVRYAPHVTCRGLRPVTACSATATPARWLTLSHMDASLLGGAFWHRTAISTRIIGGPKRLNLLSVRGGYMRGSRTLLLARGASCDRIFRRSGNDAKRLTISLITALR